MAEFVKTMKDWRRMCNACQTEKNISGVCGCYPAGNYAACAMKSMDKEADLACDNLYFERLEKAIAAWAAENPEPVYPRWIDWLADVGLIINTADHYAFNFTAAVDQIPADIAQKLGLSRRRDDMGLTEGHWFEDEYSLSERQLERAVEDEKAAYERGLRDGKHKLDWIDVNDSLPEECEDVLVYAEWESAGIDGVSKGEGVKIGWHVDGHWHIDGRCRVVAKYWTAIPELTKENQNERYE